MEASKTERRNKRRVDQQRKKRQIVSAKTERDLRYKVLAGTTVQAVRDANSTLLASTTGYVNSERDAKKDPIQAVQADRRT